MISKSCHFYKIADQGYLTVLFMSSAFYRLKFTSRSFRLEKDRYGRDAFSASTCSGKIVSRSIHPRVFAGGGKSRGKIRKRAVRASSRRCVYARG